MKDTSNDLNTTNRKKDHIDLTFQSRIPIENLDNRFWYESFLSAHPDTIHIETLPFLGKKFLSPIWISSMTGGTYLGKTINQNLAKACKDFGLGMGLGSCRSILDDNEFIKDFQVREYIGDQPLYANLGIAQIEQLLINKQLSKISELLNKLQADGLIIHVNPLQEWIQPEGDRFTLAPIDTFRAVFDELDIQIIAKEVGQGIGYQSLKELCLLPLQAIEFAAHGGTNFSKLELLRRENKSEDWWGAFSNVGHTANEMVEMVNCIVPELGEKCLCNQFIISGGIRNFLDGYYFLQKIQSPAIYGQASGFLKYATGDYDQLFEYVSSQVEGLKMAKAFLRVK